MSEHPVNMSWFCPECHKTHYVYNPNESLFCQLIDERDRYKAALENILRNLDNHATSANEALCLIRVTTEDALNRHVAKQER